MPNALLITPDNKLAIAADNTLRIGADNDPCCCKCYARFVARAQCAADQGCPNYQYTVRELVAADQLPDRYWYDPFRLSDCEYEIYREIPRTAGQTCAEALAVYPDPALAGTLLADHPENQCRYRYKVRFTRADRIQGIYIDSYGSEVICNDTGWREAVTYDRDVYIDCCGRTLVNPASTGAPPAIGSPYQASGWTRAEAPLVQWSLIEFVGTCPTGALEVYMGGSLPVWESGPTPYTSRSGANWYRVDNGEVTAVERGNESVSSDYGYLICNGVQVQIPPGTRSFTRQFTQMSATVIEALDPTCMEEPI